MSVDPVAAPGPGPTLDSPTSTYGPDAAVGSRAARSRSAVKAREFRQVHREARRLRWEAIEVVVASLLVVVAVYAIATAKPYSPGSPTGPPILGPPISITFGTPVVKQVPCSAGGTAYAESIPWNGSSEPVQVGDLNVRVYEIWDGDWVGDHGVVENVTPTSVCAGPSPTSDTDWYVVLAAPNGTNLVTYTDAVTWASVSGGAWNLWVENGSSLIIVTNPPIADTGRGFSVFGFENDSKISGSTPL